MTPLYKGGRKRKSRLHLHITPRLSRDLVDRIDRFGVSEFSANRTEAVTTLLRRGLATTLMRKADLEVLMARAERFDIIER